tara:strand:+ start:1850 stop:2476 length:627 start_codon:yes stop_codon:yes gene_type:complete
MKKLLLPIVLVLFALAGCGDSGKPEVTEELNATEGIIQAAAQGRAKLRKKAEQGDADAQVNLGVMYRNGEGVSQDDKEAVKWWRKAAEQGNAEAQWLLGREYDSEYFGSGVLKNDKEALEWYRKAAELGHAKAQFSLGGWYASGRVVTKDSVAEYAWLSLAAFFGGSKGIAMMVTDTAKKMTPKQIAEAQELAKELLKKIEANKAEKK